MKVDYTDEEPKASRVHVVLSIPIIAKRLHHNIDRYISWNRSGFDVILVCSKDEEKIVTDTIKQHRNHSIELVNYSIPNSCLNARIAKNFAYDALKWYFDQSNFTLALLIDDTLNDIVNIFSAWRFLFNKSRGVQLYSRTIC